MASGVVLVATSGAEAGNCSTTCSTESVAVEVIGSASAGPVIISGDDAVVLVVVVFGSLTVSAGDKASITGSAETSSIIVGSVVRGGADVVFSPGSDIAVGVGSVTNTGPGVAWFEASGGSIMGFVGIGLVTGVTTVDSGAIGCGRIITEGGSVTGW